VINVGGTFSISGFFATEPLTLRFKLLETLEIKDIYCLKVVMFGVIDETKNRNKTLKITER
jgi:hypothetical protein